MKKEKLKFYVNNESKLNKYEREHKKISYATLINYLFSDLILCNNISSVLMEAGEYLEENQESGNYYDDETGDYNEIYQFFIVNFNSSCSYDFLKKYCNDEIILFYSEKLDAYILGVDHFGTAWDYVLTDFEYTTDYENSMQNILYKSEV